MPMLGSPQAGIDWAVELPRWRDAVRALFKTVRDWSEQEGWLVEASEASIYEEGAGQYTLHILTVCLSSGRVHLEPVARDVLGAQGRVDIIGWPSLTRVMLLRKGETWKVKTEMGPAWPKSWGRETFVELAQLLVDEG